MAVGNLELISKTSFSNITSGDVDNIFSDTYDVYFWTANGNSTLSTNLTGVDLRLLDSSGTVISATEYDYAYLQLNTASAFVEARNTSQNKLLNYIGTADIEPEGNNSSGYIFNPYNSSSYTFFTAQNSNSFNTATRGFKYIGVHKSAETCRGVNIFSPTTENFNIDFSVYGVK